MRELVVENQEVLLIPQDYKFANRGKVTAVRAGDFTLELEYEPENIMVNTYCEFYTQTNHGTLYFDSYAENIDGKTIKVANPVKHRFLQRRQYTRIKFVNDLDLTFDGGANKITTLDISAGGMKFKTSENINIEGNYSITLPLSEKQSIACSFSPIRIEKAENGEYIVSGRFGYDNNKDKMVLTQYCAKRSIEIRNK